MKDEAAILAPLIEFINKHARIFLLTGAGVSTASGIPDYRDEAGEWKHPKPIDYRDFIRDPVVRQRYWVRSSISWQWFSQAQPNPAHKAIAELEHLGKLSLTVTQNVDGLHQKAGSKNVIDLHGRNDRVVCLDCERSIPREIFQNQLLKNNVLLKNVSVAPDGDALFKDVDYSTVNVPACKSCSGALKPDVVFFGENVPSERVSTALDTLAESDAMLVVGSSLMVYSGYRFAVKAQKARIPIVAINSGITRADGILAEKTELDCESALIALLGELGHRNRVK